MSQPFMNIGRLSRRLPNGSNEYLQFKPGVNLIVGAPGTGKTLWLRTLDYILGDVHENPFEANANKALADKYDAADVELYIDKKQYWIERRWKEKGAKTKIFVDNEGISTREFQHFLLDKLRIPILHYPKGNPMSGQTWPELSFRSLLRHMYRQQRFWSDIADKQEKGELHAAVLQFLGLAESIYSPEYEQLIKLRMEVEKLKATREQYYAVLNEMAKDFISEPMMTVGVTEESIRKADEKLQTEINSLFVKRNDLIAGARDQAIEPEYRQRVVELSNGRASCVVILEELGQKSKEISERLEEISQYQSDIENELARMTRAKDAGSVLSDIKITNCPACDQPVYSNQDSSSSCFLCGNLLPDEPTIKELGENRLQFEIERLKSELKEAKELLGVLRRKKDKLLKEIGKTEERLDKIEKKLAPDRFAISSLIRAELSDIDMEIGEINEKRRELNRINAALEIGKKYSEKIAKARPKIELLQQNVNEQIGAIYFDSASSKIEDGMNTYLNEINSLKPDSWEHSKVNIELSRSSIRFLVGDRRWDRGLGGTHKLYFLMAYHYGLLSLSNIPGCHYPGLLIIDIPAELSGQDIQDKENFAIQPFIDLVKHDEYKGAQVIVTGASYEGLENVNRIEMLKVHLA